MTKSPITTHVLDTSRGRPAQGIVVRLERLDGAFVEIAAGVTDDDGRVTALLPPGPVEEAVYKLIFETGTYFGGRGIDTFYPHVEIVFTVADENEHYHVPLLLNPFGYSTYRGS